MSTILQTPAEIALEWSTEDQVQEDAPDLVEAAIEDKVLAQTHLFSRSLAKEYGVSEALILGYLTNRIQTMGKARHDNRGFYISIKSLAKHYPYLSENTVYNALVNLREKNVLQATNQNQRKYDRTLWYTLKTPEAVKNVNWELVRFKVQDAVKHGLVAAVVLANIRYWVTENRKKNPKYTWYRLSPRKLSHHLPFSPNSILRALKSLVDAGVLAAQSCPGFDHAKEYCLKSPDFLDAPNYKMDAPNYKIDAPKDNMDAPNHKIDAPKYNTYTILEDPVRNPLLEENVREKTFINPRECLFSKTHFPPAKEKPGQDSDSLTQSMPGEASDSMGKDIADKNQRSNPKALPTSKGKGLETPSDNGKPGITEVTMGSSASLVDAGEVPKSIESALANDSSNPQPGTKTMPPSGGSVSSSKALADTSASGELNEGAGNPRSNSEPVKTTEHTIKLFPDSKTFKSQFSQKEWDNWYRQQAEQERHEELKLENQKKENERKCQEAEKYCADWEHVAGPNEEKAEDAKLSPEEKVRVLKAGLKNRLQLGLWDDVQNRHYSFNCTWNNKSLRLARRFFERNPGIRVLDVLMQLDHCCQVALYLEPYESGYDEHFYERRASSHLSFFFKELQNVLSEVGCFLDPREVVFLEEEADQDVLQTKAYKAPETPDKEDDCGMYD